MTKIAAALFAVLIHTTAFSQTLEIQTNWLSQYTPEIAAVPGSHVWVLAQHQSYNTKDARLVLHKLDEQQNLEWSQELQAQFFNAFQLIADSAGNAVVAVFQEASSPSGMDLAMLRFSPSGNLLSYQKLVFPYLNLSLSGLIPTPRGYLLSVGEHTAPVRSHLLHFAHNGTLLWEKSYFMSGGGAITVDEQGNIYQVTTIKIGIQAPHLTLVKFSPDGQFLWGKSLNRGYNAEVYALAAVANGKLVFAGRFAETPFVYPDYWLLQTDTSGQVQWSFALSHTFSHTAYSYRYRLQPAPFGGFYWQLYSAVLPEMPAAIFRVSAEGNLLWGRRLPQADVLSDLDVANNGALFSVGAQGGVAGANTLLIYRLDSTGNLPFCCADSIQLLARVVPVESKPLNFTVVEQGTGVDVEAATLETVLLNPATMPACQPGTVHILPGQICPGECVHLSLSVEEVAEDNIAWVFPGGEPGSAAGPIAGPVCYRQPGKYSVTANINVGSCTVEVTDSVEVCVPDIIPNAFTPDGDQINDVFRPVLYFPTEDYHFEIFNRWGQRVFGTTDPQQGWDGKYSDLDAPSDVYVWMLRYTEVRDENTRQARSRKGDLQLLR